MPKVSKPPVAFRHQVNQMLFSSCDLKASIQHKLFKKAKAEETKLRKQNALDNADGAFSVMPEKDKSIQVHKVYEFQFFDNFTAL